MLDNRLIFETIIGRETRAHARHFNKIASNHCDAKQWTLMNSAKKSAERLIKKYPNRRLYDTQTSSYITLADVKQLVLANEAFVVVDAKTEEDLTRSILLQIILEEESNGQPMFSSSALSQIIRYYGHAMQGMMGSYLEKNIQVFIDIQNKLAENSKGLMDEKAFSPEMWTQFMSVQAPMMQGMMSNYIEQSKSLFMQMQEQMQSQAKNVFVGFPFPGMNGVHSPEAGKA
jgi:polyhydroxyalkanoate synthesis repressor PhaR